MISALVLAAGTSSRLGTPKQLLDFRGRPLLQHAVDAAAGASLDDVVVVLGAEAERIRAAITLPPRARSVVNSDYVRGQSTSLRAGVAALHENCEAAVVLLADQPGVTADHVRRVVEAGHSTGAPVVRARFRGIPGHPVLLTRSLFPRLMELEGDVGARAVVDDVEGVVDLEMDEDPPADVDTWESYARLRGGRSHEEGDMPTVTFDVIGTLFSLDAAGDGLEAHGAPRHALDLWFVESLRDYFALSHAGSYAPLKEVLQAELPRTLSLFGVTAGEELVGDVMGAMTRLDPVPGLEEACSKLVDEGWTLQALTNGSEELTRGLLGRAGVEGHFSAVLSCDSIRVSKPNRRVYEMATGGRPEGVWMVAGHAWDVAGAKLAGMRTALIASEERGNPGFFPEPDVVADDLPSAVDRLLAT